MPSKKEVSENEPKLSDIPKGMFDDLSNEQLEGIKKASSLDIKPRIEFTELGLEKAKIVKFLDEPVYKEFSGNTFSKGMLMVNVEYNKTVHNLLIPVSLKTQLAIELCKKFEKGLKEPLKNKIIKIWKTTAYVKSIDDEAEVYACEILNY